MTKEGTELDLRMIVCNGRCEIDKCCEGKIRRVTVYGGRCRSRRNWGQYDYCEKAIQTDIKNGYEIEDSEGKLLTEE